MEVCAHALCEHAYVLTARFTVLWLDKQERKRKTKTQTLIRLLNYEGNSNGWPSCQHYGLDIYVGASLYSLLSSHPFSVLFHLAMKSVFQRELVYLSCVPHVSVWILSDSLD